MSEALRQTVEAMAALRHAHALAERDELARLFPALRWRVSEMTQGVWRTLAVWTDDDGATIELDAEFGRGGWQFTLTVSVGAPGYLFAIGRDRPEIRDAVSALHEKVELAAGKGDACEPAVQAARLALARLGAAVGSQPGSREGVQ